MISTAAMFSVFVVVVVVVVVFTAAYNAMHSSSSSTFHLLLPLQWIPNVYFCLLSYPEGLPNTDIIIS